MRLKRKKRIFLILIIALTAALFLTGCRVRTGTGAPAADRAGETADARAGSALPETEGTDAPLAEGMGARTRENSLADRKEFDERANVEIVQGTDRLLNDAGDGEGMPIADAEGSARADLLSDSADKTAERTLPAEKADKKSADPDAKEAESAFEYYSVLLRGRLDTLFECKRLNVYWETAEDHVTVFRTSPEHSLILNAGAYDVSARLLKENLRVDDGWIGRKDPGVIVRAVGRDTLGSGVTDTGRAKKLRDEILSRPGFAGIDAVKNGRVLILAQELLEAPHLVLAAQLLLAKTANPELFSDVDPDRMLTALIEEAAGAPPAGTYWLIEEKR